MLGETPPTGSGVFRFPQAIAYSPGGSTIVVGDQYSAVVQKFDYTGVDQGWSVGGYADRGQLKRFGVIGGEHVDAGAEVDGEARRCLGPRLVLL